ncbi:pyridoxal-phosphate dependent enzyme [Virgibacillus sp. YIM 98842]|uniref:1-aminocyclopropane-1-carboxylate deaminase/D-cysteine desulfhydrase n=1 Tax=Virgibacillus sp. YIM 98842 TaxID=2663533 RepID=UPI0013D96D98|nr:pyridoxal-phosphate dependent enzyme [Virgibacillus sp. YIM 98842]
MDRLQFTNLPTPINFFDHYDSNNIYIKRDDLTDFSLGGNKARKLEYFMADALNNNHDCIVTYGGHQSNHNRITAAAASKYRLKIVLILSKAEDINKNGNYFLYSLYDAEIVWTDIDKVPHTIDSTLSDLEQRGYNPYFIQGGGHGNLGTHAYRVAYEEIIKQEINKNIKYDYIFLASGTGTTQAGLEVGVMENSSHTNIMGISVARNKIRGTDVIYESLKEYCEFQNIEMKISKKDIWFDDSYVGQGYADIYSEITDTIKYVAKKSAIILDPVYTGKAFHGMLTTINKENIRNKNILFIHTGGIPLIFTHAEAFERKLE